MQSKLGEHKGRAAHTEQGVTILIEVHGVKDPAEIRTLADTIKTAIGDKKNAITIKVVRSGAVDPARERKPSGAWAVDPRQVKPDGNRLALPGKPGEGKFFAPVKPPQDNSDHRIDMLEKKLDAVLKELEALRKSKSSPSRNNSTKGIGVMSGWPPAPGAASPPSPLPASRVAPTPPLPGAAPTPPPEKPTPSGVRP